MQNRTDFGTPRFSIPQSNMDVSSYDIAIKIPKWTKYKRNLYNFIRFLVCSQYFKFSFHYMRCQARFRL